MSLNERIKAFRKEKHMSQRQLAMKVNVSQGAVSQWETGATTPTAEQITPLADAFGITADELLGHEKKAPSREETGLNEFILELLKARPDLRPVVLKFLQLPDEQRSRVLGYLEAVEETSQA